MAEMVKIDWRPVEEAKAAPGKPVLLRRAGGNRVDDIFVGMRGSPEGVWRDFNTLDPTPPPTHYAANLVLPGELS